MPFEEGEKPCALREEEEEAQFARRSRQGFWLPGGERSVRNGGVRGRGRNSADGEGVGGSSGATSEAERMIVIVGEKKAKRERTEFKGKAD